MTQPNETQCFTVGNLIEALSDIPQHYACVMVDDDEAGFAIGGLTYLKEGQTLFLLSAKLVEQLHLKASVSKEQIVTRKGDGIKHVEYVPFAGC